MIDDEDVWFAAILSDFSSTIASIISIVLIIVFGYFACSNNKECNEMKCDNGANGKLIDHECLCVTKAVKP